jgi:hypothetical protein
MIKQAKHQKGFILLLVIALIPLLGMASIVLTSNSRQILTNTRRSTLKTQSRFACESGVAWIKENPQHLPAKNQPLVLEIENTDKKVNCTIELISQTREQSKLKIIGHAEDKRFSNYHQQQYVLTY